MADLRRPARFAVALGMCVAIAACTDADQDTAADTSAAAGAVGAVTDAANRTLGGAGYSDAEIMGYLAAANNAEIALSGLGARRATNAAVKQFAQQMITEHTTMRNEGQQLAQRLNINPATRQDFDVREDASDMITDLEDEQGRDFDQEFMEKQIDLHDRVLNRIDDFRNATQNAELRQMLERARPLVEQHRQRAEQIKNNRVS